MYTQSQILELMFKYLPTPKTVRDINLSIPETVIFTYLSGSIYRVDNSLFVEEILDGVLVCNVKAKWIESLLEGVY